MTVFHTLIIYSLYANRFPG